MPSRRSGIAVKVVGWAHGVLFVVLCAVLLWTTVVARWPIPRAAMVFVAALLPFGQNVPGAVVIAAVQYDPTAPAQGPLNLLPELFDRLRKFYLVVPTAEELVEVTTFGPITAERLAGQIAPMLAAMSSD